MAMDAKLFEEGTVFKVVAPGWVKRIGFRFDLHVSPNAGLGRVHQPKQFRFSVRRPLAGVCRERAAFPSQPVPVSLGNPVHRPVLMPPFGPTPEALPDDHLHFAERLCRRDMTVIICPAPDDRVEHLDQKLLFDRFVPADYLPDFFQESVLVFLGRFDQKFTAIFSDVHSEEVEPLFDGRDAGFLG
jgi:hypothetical protein